MIRIPKGYNHILALIDGFTKFSWLFLTNDTTTTEMISKLLVLESTFGSLERIIPDNRTSLTAAGFKLYCEERQIHHVLITTGMPMSNGQVERLNSTIINVLAKLCIDNPNKWRQKLPKVQMAQNSSFQRIIGMTSIRLTFGVEMRHAEYTRSHDVIS